MHPPPILDTFYQPNIFITRLLPDFWLPTVPFGLSVVHQTKTLSNPLSHRPLGQSPEWWKVFVERSPPALPKGKNWDFKGPTKLPVNNRMTGMIIHSDTLIDKIQKLFWVPAFFFWPFCFPFPPGPFLLLMLSECKQPRPLHSRNLVKAVYIGVHAKKYDILSVSILWGLLLLLLSRAAFLRRMLLLSVLHSLITFKAIL